jgi:hypothetical protein
VALHQRDLRPSVKLEAALSGGAPAKPGLDIRVSLRRSTERCNFLASSTSEGLEENQNAL